MPTMRRTDSVTKLKSTVAQNKAPSSSNGAVEPQAAEWSQTLRHQKRTSVSGREISFSNEGMSIGLCATPCAGEGTHECVVRIGDMDAYGFVGMAPPDAAAWDGHLGQTIGVGLRDDGILARDGSYRPGQGSFQKGDMLQITYVAKDCSLRIYQNGLFELLKVHNVPRGWHFAASGMGVKIEFCDKLPPDAV